MGKFKVKIRLPHYAYFVSKLNDDEDKISFEITWYLTYHLQKLNEYLLVLNSEEILHNLNIINRQGLNYYTLEYTLNKKT